jgi:hydrogenase expression/formation protein HypC
MCIGRPMKVYITNGFDLAACDDRCVRTQVDISLTPDVQVGQWVLVFLGASRQVLSDEKAAEICDALAALEAATEGANLDHFFADLTHGEPSLPPHMEAARLLGRTTV